MDNSAMIEKIMNEVDDKELRDKLLKDVVSSSDKSTGNNKESLILNELSQFVSDSIFILFLYLFKDASSRFFLFSSALANVFLLFSLAFL